MRRRSAGWGFFERLGYGRVLLVAEKVRRVRKGRLLRVSRGRAKDSWFVQTQ